MPLKVSVPSGSRKDAIFCKRSFSQPSLRAPTATNSKARAQERDRTLSQVTGPLLQPGTNVQTAKHNTHARTRDSWNIGVIASRVGSHARLKPANACG